MPQISGADLGFLRVAAASPTLRVADVAFNLGQISALIEQAAADACQVLVFPELALTGYTCADLFFQQLLLEKVEHALLALAEVSSRYPLLLVVGAPLEQRGRLYSCGVVINQGNIIGAVPKTCIPNRNGLYEKRWFSSGEERTSNEVSLGDLSIPFGNDLLFQQQAFRECCIGIELGADAEGANPGSGDMAQAGATLICNLSASAEVVGSSQYRRHLVEGQSARCVAAYVYAAAGAWESSTDQVFAGHCLIAEKGTVLAQSERFGFDPKLISCDVDLQRLDLERRRNSGFTASNGVREFNRLPFSVSPWGGQQLRREIDSTPFVPRTGAERSERCEEIFAIQTTALARRLLHTGSKRAVIGVSGGLDSTLALLVLGRAVEMLGLGSESIVAVSMPGFGTTARTKSNAEKLIDHLGASKRVISIDAAVRQHFNDIGHDEENRDITYENAQARERTQILMDIANQQDGIVIGTGDLSELALGWCTYNADHMSMYSVNCGVPKTLVRYMVEWCAETLFSAPIRAVLEDICATPISPELLPPDEYGEIRQATEEQVGPYALHDFFLFHAGRNQFAPRKVFYLANIAFGEQYPVARIKHWLRNFYARFFSQQFKRSCLPDGPKVGTVALSPRSDWRMPSDAGADLWLAEVDALSGLQDE